MKKRCVTVIFCLIFMTGCAGLGTDTNEIVNLVAEPTEASAIPEAMRATIHDWILGTDYGIEDVDFDGNTFTIDMPEEKQAKLADDELSDITTALTDLGAAFGFSQCSIVFKDGSTVAGSGSAQENEGDNIPAPGETVNLIFIHHSVGENWLNDGLCQSLNESNIHVADTYYGWSNMGDYTDTADWPRWFNDDVMPSVYGKLSTETAQNTIEPGDGENTIIMFKSCYPNSEVGDSIDDEKAIYNSLLDYFAQHTDKMFVLITPPPMQNISNPKKTRELANYLVDQNGWLKDYPYKNVFVFDLYNVLTAPDNHHMLVDGFEEHIVSDPNNTLYYDSGGDDHPNTQGNIKATEEFVPLLLYWYSLFAQ